MRAALILLTACTDAPPAPPLAPVSIGVHSPDVGEDGRISAAAGCGPGSRTPALRWSGLPPEARSMAVLITSRSTLGDVVHWTAWDLDPTSGGVEAGRPPTVSPPLQGVTSGGRVGWAPVCGLPDDATLVIEVAALDEAALPPPTVTAPALRARLAPHLVGLGRLEARPPATPPQVAP